MFDKQNIFIVSLVLFYTCSTRTLTLAVDVPLSDHTFNGFDAGFEMTKSNLQMIIDRYNSRSGPNDVKFFIPDRETYPHIHYAVYVGFGKVTAQSLAESMSEEDLAKFDISHDIIHAYVPFLSSEEGGRPELRLDFLSFTSTQGRFVSPNVIFDFLRADELSYQVEGDGVVRLSFRFENLALEMAGEIPSSCREPPQQDVNELETSMVELAITQNRPNFSICDELTNPSGNQFCKVAEDYKTEIDESGSNVCIRWTPVAGRVERCDAVFHIFHISNELKDALGLDENHPNSLAAEKVNGLFDINLNFPCVE